MTSLAHGFLELTVSTRGVTADIQKALDGLAGDARRAGEKVGAALSQGVSAKAADPLGPLRADLATYERQAASTARAVERAQERQADAARKVALEEARLAEVRSGSQAKQSTVLAAEDRLEKARRAQARAVLELAAAEKRATRTSAERARAAAAVEKAEKDQARAAQASAQAAGGVEQANRRIGQSLRDVTGRVRESVRAFGQRISSPFGRVPEQAAQAGQQAAARMEAGFRSRSSGIGAAIKGSLLGGLAVGAALQAGNALAEGLRNSVGAASDLGETQSKSAAIFKQQAAAMDAWAVKAPKALGLSRSAALEAASGFGNMFSQLGFASDKAAGMSQTTVQLAADLGSFNNLGTDQVVDMLSAAFRGEYDSLQRLIPNINAARVEQEALAATGKRSAKDLTAQEKAAATLAIVMRDGAAASGDFARTSDGLANRQKIVAAQVADLQSKLGDLLLPVVQQVLGWISDRGLPIVERLGDGISGVVQILATGEVPAAFAAAFGVTVDSPLVDLLRRIREGAAGVSVFVQTVLVPALGQLAAWIQAYVVPGLAEVGGAVAGLRNTVLPIVQQFAAGMMERIAPMMPQIREVFQIIGEIVHAAMTHIRVLIEAATVVIGYIWDHWGNEIMTVLAFTMSRVLAIAKPALELLRDTIRIVTAVIRGDWGAVWENLKAVTSDSVRLIVEIVRYSPLGIAVAQMLTQAREAFAAGMRAIQNTWRRIVDIIGGPVKVVESIINGLITAFNAVDRVFGGKHQVGHVTISWPQPQHVAFARGGVMPGYTPGRDVHRFWSPTGGSLDLSGGEAVMRPEWTAAVGAGFVDTMNEAARRGGIRGVRRAMWGQAFASGGLVTFRGHTFTAEFARRLQIVERMAGPLSITQGGWRPRTSYSGTSHAGDALDIAPFTIKQIAALRSVGIPTWDRTGKGNWISHAHGVPLPFAGRAGGSAIWQAQDYLRGGDGLGGRDNGPKVGVQSGLDGVALNLDGVASSLVNWTSQFAPLLGKAKELANGFGPWGAMLAEIPGRIAQGIADGAKDLVGFAQGTRSAPPGLAWVGEEGPEIVNFRGGEVVLPHEESVALAAGVGEMIVVIDGQQFRAYQQRLSREAALTLRTGR